MRFYISLLLFFFILYTQNISAANSDFNSLIKGKKESTIAHPQGLQYTFSSFSLENKKVIAVFSELDKTLVLDNFPIGNNQLSTVELTISPSSVDSRTKVFIGNQQIPLPFVSSFIGTIHNEHKCAEPDAQPIGRQNFSSKSRSEGLFWIKIKYCNLRVMIKCSTKFSPA